jgi:3-methylfumaryl-CoA hydratase
MSEATTPLIDESIRAWIGRSDPPQRIEITRRDIQKYSAATEQRLPKYVNGDEAPPMFLFGAHNPIVALSQLGADGLRPDSLLPDLPLKRVMAGGSKQEFFRALHPGDVVDVQRRLVDIYEKRGSSGPLIFVVYTIDVTTESGEPVFRETQTRIVR